MQKPKIDNPFDKPTLIKPTTQPYLDRYLVQQVDWDKVLKIVEKHVGEYLKKVQKL